MDATAPVEPDLRWREPVVVSAVALAVMFGLILYSPNFGEIAGLLVVGPVTVLILIVLAFKTKRRARWVRFALLCCFALVGWQMLGHSEVVRSESRWLIDSRHWKEAVLATPVTDSGLKWVVWDGWGMFAQDTDVYLVFSPDDELRNYSPTNLHGLPCPVWRVQRLEKQWYSVTFYTNEGWAVPCGGQDGKQL
jgi:hypothetical protein